VDEDLLTQLAAAAAEVARTEDALKAAQARRDDLIRRALAANIRPKAVIAASGVKAARVYQIRDGR